MANEAELRVRYGDPVDMTVADNTGIEKGAILKLADPLTASLSSSANDIVAGIAAREKVASDGRTRLAVFRQGVFDVFACGAITVGDPVKTAGTANQVAKSAATSGANILGVALETATDGETILVELNPMGLRNV